MEERLSQFIDAGLTPDIDLDAAAGALRFAHHQVVKLAEDCLRKSRDQLLSSDYFYELSESLQTLMNDVCIYAAISASLLITLISILIQLNVSR